MKYVIYGMGMFAAILGFVFFFFAIRTKPMKQEELSYAVGQAMKETLVTAMENNNTNMECGRMFCEMLENNLKNKGEIQVEIIQLDVQKGIFRAKVSLEYTYINGAKGRVETDRTLIYDGERGEGV